MRICNEDGKKTVKYNDLKPGDVFLFFSIDDLIAGFSKPFMVIDEEDRSGNYKYVDLESGEVIEFDEDINTSLWSTPDADVVKLNYELHYTIGGDGT